MKKLSVMAVVGVGLIGAVGGAMAQPYGGPDYGYRDRGDYRDREYRSRDGDYRDRDYRDRRDDYGRRDDYRGRDRDYGSRDRDRDYGSRDRDRGSRDQGAAFNEREYLRCNPDVARAVLAGKMQSGYKHFQVHGFREGRKLTC
ncbi:hypothetical protein [Methylobacterium platani]|uniref:Lectin-like protein BA14k n=2 Tax=Methylobacterium platani TaxID=427683 RepID=A0A179RZG6_9HYPH|nr:hypothetical protein [Methylobacterium platani]KMO12060.1 hypothetical protein SQ03_25410 [Methylobacterium platani JCM 14648]OAS14437.1 hypothetical protein A5481_30360 [Methylobacterium platani]